MNVLEVLVCVAIIAIMWATFRDALINWGQSHSALSTLLVMIAAAVAWQMLIRWSPKIKTDSQQPNLTQSATASGGSTINQSGRDMNISQGVQEETVKEMLKQKSLAGMADYALRYPHGYVILGLVNGELVYDTELRDIEIKADWKQTLIKIDRQNKSLIVTTPRMKIFLPGQEAAGFFYWGNAEMFDFIENKPHPSLLIPGMYYEVVDATNDIYLIGFK